MSKHVSSRLCGALALAAAAAMGASALARDPPLPVVVQPGYSVAPFAGFWASGVPIASPKFGVIEAVGQPHPPLMYVGELGGAQVVSIDPFGVVMPYTVPLLPGGVAGVDFDTKIENMFGATLGLYGGPPAMWAAQVMGGGALYQVTPGGGWFPWVPLAGAQPGFADLKIDRTPNFTYNGFLYVAEWGGDATDGIYMLPPGPPGPPPVPFAPMPGLDPRYFTFDTTGGATGYGPNFMWVSSFNSGQIIPISPAGVMGPPLAVLQPGLEGLSFALGDPYFGSKLYAANLTLGTIDTIAPDGSVTPFAFGFPGAAYLLFVNAGPFAVNGNPTLYVLDGLDSVWVITPNIAQPCPADLNGDGVVDASDLAILLGAWGPC